MTAPAVLLRDIEYRAFPDVPRRDFMQEAFELLAHPARTHGRRLPSAAAPELVTLRDRVLWKARVRLASGQA